MDPEDRFNEIIEKAEGLPSGTAKVQLMEEAVRLADTMRNEQLAFESRYELTSAAQFGGRPDIALVSFVWCLAYMDAHRDEVEPWQVLWQYKWVVNGAAAFPDIPRDRIDSLFEDMVKRHKEYGSTLHAAHQIRRDMALAMHDPALAKSHDTIFRQLKRDDLSNCKACVPDANIDYHSYFGDDEAAIAEAREIVRGRVSCGEVPHRTYPKLMMCHLRLRNYDEAMKYHKLAYPMIRDNPSFLEHQGACIAFLAVTGNFNRMTALLSRHTPMALEHPDQLERFRFYNCVKLALEIASEANKELTWSVPTAISTTPDPFSIGVWLDNELYTTAAKFDARNGNKGFENAISQMAKYRELCHRLPYKTSE
ncbi:MAG: hypothetical protein ACRC8S_12330 [Fimbriiglobus sp.]